MRQGRSIHTEAVSNYAPVWVSCRKVASKKHEALSLTGVKGFAANYRQVGSRSDTEQTSGGIQIQTKFGLSKSSFLKDHRRPCLKIRP